MEGCLLPNVVQGSGGGSLPLYKSGRGANPESFSFPEELFLVKEVGGTTLVALKLRATESHLMQRVVGTLSLPREGENPANGFANGLPSWEGKFCGGFRRLEEEPG